MVFVKASELSRTQVCTLTDSGEVVITFKPALVFQAKEALIQKRL